VIETSKNKENRVKIEDNDFDELAIGTILPYACPSDNEHYKQPPGFLICNG